MKHLVFIITIINSIIVYSQQATIKFENLEKFKEVNYIFEINRTKFKPNNQTYKIKINKKNEFDTLIFYDIKSKNKQISFAKFKENKVYIIRFSPCSSYIIYPAKKRGIGKIKVISDEINKNLKVSFCSDEIILEQIKSKYSKCYPSAMCRFSYQKIELIENEDKIVDYFNFHFLHKENLKIIVTNKKMKFKI